MFKSTMMESITQATVVRNAQAALWDVNACEPASLLQHSFSDVLVMCFDSYHLFKYSSDQRYLDSMFLISQPTLRRPNS